MSFGVTPRVKLKVIVPMTLTGTPERVVGLNFHPVAAATAESLSNGWPEMALAATTLPSSSTVNSTTTAPDIRAALATGGYRGWTFLIAELWSTPPDLRINMGAFSLLSSL